LGGSRRVGSERGHGGSCERNLKGNLQEFSVPGPWENIVGSGVRSDVLSPGRGGALRDVAGSGRSSVAGPRIRPWRNCAGNGDRNLEGCPMEPSSGLPAQPWARRESQEHAPEAKSGDSPSERLIEFAAVQSPFSAATRSGHVHGATRETRRGCVPGACSARYGPCFPHVHL
jgi:hypothetical protein